MKPIFFSSAAEFRAWLEKNHATAAELFIGYYKAASAKRGLAYKEAVDEALCFGWIDGVVRRIDDERYLQRFTPRRPGSIWSNNNVANVERLAAAGWMRPAGLAAFAARKPEKTGIYAFENRARARLPSEFERRFRANERAWAFFQAQPPSYRRTAIHKVISPQQAATRERWLARLIADSAAGKRLAALTPTPRRRL